MSKIEWMDGNRIRIDPPKKTKKVTGTRFASILGLNPWATPFEMWCAITKTYEKPFEDSIYTIAGKTIEPKQAEYMKKSYGMDLITPTDVYGSDYFQKTFGDFFKEDKILGGMWDYLAKDEDGNVDTVLEMKTTKRAEDWQADVPEYYALQAALYAYLKGLDNIIMVCSFLEESDYEHPENYIPNSSNTITREFKLSERYPDFEEMIQEVRDWWRMYVETGISPEYDTKADAEILKALGTNYLSPDTDIESLIREAEDLKTEITAVTSSIVDKEKRLKKVTDMIKEYAISQFRDGDKAVNLRGKSYEFKVSRSISQRADIEALVADGLFDKYIILNETYKMTMGVKK